MNMERAPGSGYAQHQATQTVFVIGVVLNDLAARDHLAQLGDRDSPLNALIEWRCENSNAPPATFARISSARFME